MCEENDDQVALGSHQNESKESAGSLRPALK